MEFMEAKCPVCAKRIQIPSNLEKPYCTYCSAWFLKEAALVFAGTAVLTANIEPSYPSDFVIVGGALIDYRSWDAEVSIPEGITCIGEDAFKGNKRIVSVFIPDTVTSIDNSAFCGCSSMQTIRMPESRFPCVMSADESLSFRQLMLSSHLAPENCISTEKRWSAEDADHSPR